MWHCLEFLDLPFVTASSRCATQDLLRAGNEPTVVVTAVAFPDGSWCDLLTEVAQSHLNAGIVLYSDAADERLWSEAIWRGASDVVLAPFDPRQLRWCIETVGRAIIDRGSLEKPYAPPSSFSALGS
jgi:DNA-binding NtrC family response regulator